MRKLALTIAAAVALFTAGAASDRADAMTPGAPAGLRAAIDQTSTTETVAYTCTHWWYGRWHPFVRCGWYPSAFYFGHRRFYGGRHFYRGYAFHGHRFHGGHHFRGRHR
jgi:hypothetical protein